MNQVKFDDNNRQQSRDDEVVAENVDDENTVIEAKTSNNNLSKNFFILFEQIITQNQRSGSIDATPANTPVIVKSRKIFINNNDQSDTTTSKVSIINKDDDLQFRGGDNVKNEEKARQEESCSSNTSILKPSIIANFAANRDRWNAIAKRRTPMGLHPETKSMDLLQSNSKSKSFCLQSIPKSTAEETHDEESTAASTKLTSSTSCSSNDDISGLLYTELDDDESQDHVQEKKEIQEEQTNPSQILHYCRNEWVEFEKNSFLPPKEEQEHCQKNMEYTDCLPEKEKIDSTMGDHELKNPQHDLSDTQINYLCCCISDFPQFSFLVGDNNKKYNKLHVPKNETI